jgi:hypothetical protein
VLLAVGEEGVQLRAIADGLGKGLRVPVRSIMPDEAPGYFGWMAVLAGEDIRARQDRRAVLVIITARLATTDPGPDRAGARS